MSLTQIRHALHWQWWGLPSRSGWPNGDDDSDDLQIAKPTLMKIWVTGQKSEMEHEDIDRELFKLAREWMSVSKLRNLKLPGHVQVAKESYAALWKKFRHHPRRSSTVNNSPKSAKLPVDLDTVQSDQTMGWGHFTRKVFKLGIDPNTC
jgi:hypothetical protein